MSRCVVFVTFPNLLGCNEGMGGGETREGGRLLLCLYVLSCAMCYNNKK